jgi:hypothetical protein
MSEEELLLQAANMPTMYFDGFTKFVKVNGVLRCIGYVIGAGAQLNLIISLAGADEANQEARRVLDGQQPTKGLVIWEGGAGTTH